MDSTILKAAEAWANNTLIDEADRKEISDLINQKNEKELTERFYKDLEFGTGGLRGIMGMGRNRMNKYNVRRATQAVCNVLKQSGDKHTVAISYDSRKGSKEFALEAAGVLAANGIDSLVYKFLTPVPLLSYSVRYNKASAGIMVTASHNPKIYNGYKLFWNDGSQVTPPNDQIVIDEYAKVDQIEKIKFMPAEEAENKSLIKWVGDEMVDAYFKDIKATLINPELCSENSDLLKIVYTPIHGTGLKFVTRMLDDLGIKSYHVVPEQAEPDGEFPTASTPNPELPETLELAVKMMENIQGDLVMGTDPDTDRLGVVARHEGENFYLNGNQLANLMLHYTLSQRSQKGTLPDNPLVLKTIVTSELQKTICDHYRVRIENTLTGFKWMGARLKEIEDKGEGLNYVFGSEESFGFLTHDFCRDKDAVSAIGLFAEMALFHKKRGKTLIEALDEIYEEFGFSHENLVSINYLGKEGKEKMERIMNSFRTNPPKEICGEEVRLIDDYLTLQTVESETGKTHPLNFPKSNVLGFTFKSGNKLLMRPSGTEPKIKFYTLLQEKEGTLSEKKSKANKKSQEIENFIKDFCEKA